MFLRETGLIDANANTLEWLWSMPPGSESITEWLSAKKGIFWIQSKPGSGKSTIMKYMKGEARTLKYLRRASNNPWVIIRFFFDFRAEKTTPNNLEGLLRSMLRQLAMDVPHLTPFIEEFGKESTMVQDVDQAICWDVDRLRRGLITGIQNCSKDVCMFVDGLDEFEGKGSEILNILSFFQNINNLDGPSRRVKVCLASRPESLMIEALGKSWGFKVQDYNTAGIYLFADRDHNTKF